MRGSNHGEGASNQKKANHTKKGKALFEMKKTNSKVHFFATLPRCAIRNAYKRKCHRRSQKMTQNQKVGLGIYNTKDKVTHKPGTSECFIKCYVNQLTYTKKKQKMKKRQSTS